MCGLSSGIASTVELFEVPTTALVNEGLDSECLTALLLV